jgi:hypothetical protein
MKIGYQLKQVRERLAKGLVDKGILRTEKRNFLLFDMATHPVVDSGAKEEIRRRVRNVLTQRTVVLNNSQWLPENLEFRYVRTLAMVCAAYAANVLENALSTLGHEAREKAFNQTDELLADYSQWPFGRKATGNDIGENLPGVIAEVGIPIALVSPVPLITDRSRSAGNQQVPREGAPARSRCRVPKRLHPSRLPPLAAQRSPCRRRCVPDAAEPNLIQFDMRRPTRPLLASHTPTCVYVTGGKPWISSIRYRQQTNRTIIDGALFFPFYPPTPEATILLFRAPPT